MKHLQGTLLFLSCSTIFVGAFSTIKTSSLYLPCTKLSSSATNDQSQPSSSPIELIGDKCDRGGIILDEDAILRKQNFAISPQDLIAKAKYALKKDSGVLEPALWAPDFEFCAPYIGPLNSAEFLDAADGFNIYDAFPDFDNRYANFSVDPLEPGRVWFFVRLIATDTGGLFGKEPTEKTVQLPPQVFSFKFNEDGLIRELTVGYSVDRRQGDTGGVGGMFGLFYGVGQGLPFREGQPLKTSLKFRLFTRIGNVVSKLSKKK
eukprot:CAMPEP_0198264640 /NCGR_PEP_ID=MMETSP1447-20131203/16274_1 /TAXON_ID=420782 /ORGANISM="Chaetoceros dichaeta, Strain CCMP1751" /LENGTH=261 /DNA_ID=CAMNT_0043953641 /DNA_START=1 /DNA_END=786 /DNA_ORIENTATION=-